ncbi:hypothetical protein HK102_011602, partial [Quaeritorhiza haematococci]
MIKTLAIPENYLSDTDDLSRFAPPMPSKDPDVLLEENRVKEEEMKARKEGKSGSEKGGEESGEVKMKVKVTGTGPENVGEETGQDGKPPADTAAEVAADINSGVEPAQAASKE